MNLLQRAPLRTMKSSSKRTRNSWIQTTITCWRQSIAWCKCLAELRVAWSRICLWNRYKHIVGSWLTNNPWLWFQLQKKEAICREVIAVCQKLDPAQVRLNIYNAAALYELHLPLLQYGKRKWETGDLATEDFRLVKVNGCLKISGFVMSWHFCRKTLYEPRDCMKEAMELLENETNDNLPEGQLRIQIKDTLGQLEQFMKTLGCEDI